MSTAHAHGIKVILDVTTHGVVPGSPLIRNRPEYFRTNLTGEYRMVDYNYSSPEWRQYWPSIFIDLVKRSGARFPTEILLSRMPSDPTTHVRLKQTCV